MTSAATAAEHLAAIRERRPLIHNITNFVVMNETANALLALGAAPVMAHALEEVAEAAEAADALVLNIGTLWPGQVEAMLRAGQAANRASLPVVLDPVGAGFTRLRSAAAARLLEEVAVTVVRANAAELAALAGGAARVRGVDCPSAVADAAELAQALARERRCTVAVSGATDYVAGGDRLLAVGNGHPLMAQITGSGCMASALCAAFAAVCEDPTQAAAEALAVFGLAGERAAAGAPGPGSFHVRLYDELAALAPRHVRAAARIERLSGGER